MNLFSKAWPLFGLVAFWDAVTTVIGTVQALGAGGIVTIVFGVLVGLAVAAILFFTFDIWAEYHPALKEHPFVQALLKCFWTVAFIYNASTAFYGNSYALGLKMDNIGEVAVLVAATIIVSGSTIVAAFLFYWSRGRGE